MNEENKMYEYLLEHNYVSKNENKNPLRQQELSKERAECIANKYNNLVEELQNNCNELNKLIDDRIGDCRYFLANADVNYEKENMKKFMWLKEELQILKSKVQELEQGKDE